MSDLTKQQEEVLRIMQEECGEVVQMVSKVCRFGIDEQHLKADKPNRDRLTEEIGDLLCMIELAKEFDIVRYSDITAAAKRKRTKLEKWSTIFIEELQD